MAGSSKAAARVSVATEARLAVMVLPFFIVMVQSLSDFQCPADGTTLDHQIEKLAVMRD